MSRLVPVPEKRHWERSCCNARLTGSLFYKQKYFLQCRGNAVQYRNSTAMQVYSELSLNGHLYKADTSIRRTPGDGPCRFSVILL